MMKKTSFTLIIFCIIINLYAQKQGQARIDSLLAQLPKAKQDSNKVKLLDDLSYTYSNIAPDEGIKYGQQALSITEKLKWRNGTVESDRVIGINYFNKSDYAEAKAYYDKALKIAEDLNNKLGIAEITVRIGTIYHYAGNYAQALEYDLRSLKMEEELDNKNGLANVEWEIGRVYNELNDYSRSLEYLNKALKIFEQLYDKEGEIKALEDIGNVYYAEREYSKALEYFNKALGLDEKLGDKKHIATILGSIGSINEDQGNYPRALEYYNKSLKINLELNSKYTIGRTLGNIGDTYLYIAKDTAGAHEKTLPDDLRNKTVVLRKAVIYLNQGIQIAKEIADIYALQYYFQDLTEVQALSGNYKEALESHKQYSLFHDSAFSSESNKKIASLETKRQTDLKQKEIDILNKDKQIQVSEIKRQTLIRNLVLGSVGVAGIFAFLFVRSFNRKRKNAFDKQVSEVEMKALRAQMNPHFIFNSLNSIHRFIQLNNTDDASEYLIKFSKLMRLILENSRYKEVLLEKDLEALRLYMELESARMDHKFTYEIKTGDDLDEESTMIPPLILQPFVENAIWHGMMNKEGVGKITVIISKENDMISCVVEDDGVGRDKAMQLKSSLPREKHEFLGVKLTHDRINIINSIKKSKAYITITDLYDEDKNPSGTRVEVKLPLELSF